MYATRTQSKMNLSLELFEYAILLDSLKYFKTNIKQINSAMSLPLSSNKDYARFYVDTLNQIETKIITISGK